MEIHIIIKLQSIVRGYLHRKKLLNDLDILKWIMLSEKFKQMFAQSRKKDGKSVNIEEKTWGFDILKRIRPDTKKTNQWTTILAEEIVKMLLTKKGLCIRRAKTKNGFRPDFECDNFIYEVKCRNYTTSGTAGEKILGCPLKYIDIPKIYKKPLKIIVVAYQELEAIDNFKLFDSDVSKEKRKILKMYKKLGIEYVKCSDLFKQLL